VVALGGGLAPRDDRLLPADPAVRRLARELYDQVRGLQLVSPHGHIEAALLAANERLPDPATLLITRDHYVTRLLHSQGVPMERLGMAPADSGHDAQVPEPREIWRRLAENWAALRGMPSRLWLEQTLETVFRIRTPLSPTTSDAVYDELEDNLGRDEFLPRALFDRFGLEVMVTTDSPLDSLEHHRAIADSPWPGRVLPGFRPDDVVNADRPEWRGAVERLGEAAAEEIGTYGGYIRALENRRRFFASHGAMTTDHGHASARAESLDEGEAARLYDRLLASAGSVADTERFRAHMLMEFARMSCEDGLVMQLHPGAIRGHDRPMAARFGADIGADIPTAVEYVHAMRPLLERYGHHPRFRLIVFTLDEATYSRELAPMAGYYPALLLGPPWWFHDSPEGLLRFREWTLESAGFYNTVGFTDDARSFPSIPARHDVARRIDCGFLAGLVAERRLTLDEAHETAIDLAYRLPKKAYRL